MPASITDADCFLIMANPAFCGRVTELTLTSGSMCCLDAATKATSERKWRRLTLGALVRVDAGGILTPQRKAVAGD